MLILMFLYRKCACFNESVNFISKNNLREKAIWTVVRGITPTLLDVAQWAGILVDKCRHWPTSCYRNVDEVYTMKDVVTLGPEAGARTSDQSRNQ
uniref:Uncharacterized protein n=1 Tax=Timema bartmani TaxID=61472 RepID=A0A7R9ESF9_9NEOP|nr:unnamed protein product [Timema bartmani]